MSETEFAVTFEWREDGRSVGEINLTGTQWDAVYRWALRLSPKVLDKLSEYRVERVDLASLTHHPDQKVFMTVEQLNEWLLNGDRL